jgi:hypothetical protein
MNRDYGLDPEQLVIHVIRPTLQYIDLWSPAAGVLVLGTGLTESKLRYVDQIDQANKPGPAYGLWQCEERTHADYWDNFLRFQNGLREKCIALVSRRSALFPPVGELVFNLAYAAAMCRVHYRRVKAPLPDRHDALSMAEYWKHYYNGPGKGTVQKALPHFQFATKLEVFDGDSSAQS